MKTETMAVIVAVILAAIWGIWAMEQQPKQTSAAPPSVATIPAATPIETKAEFEARVAANNREQKTKAMAKAEYEQRLVSELEAKAEGNLEVVHTEWHKGGFDTVALWSVTFRNNGDKPIGNIRYRTTYKAETGDEVDHGGVEALLGDYTIRKVVAPHKKRTIEINDGFINHEAARGSFTVVSCEFIDGGTQ